MYDIVYVHLYISNAVLGPKLISYFKTNDPVL